MAVRESKHIFQGMNRDISADKQKGIFYLDAKNIRITAREDGTLLSVTNEKGNKLLRTPFSIKNYIGHAVLNNYLVLFIAKDDSIQNSKDLICRVDFTNPDDPISTILYSGDLSFSVNCPIETLVDYETEELQKVYWTDGKNQPRVINIVSNTIKPDDNTQFDFTPSVYKNNTDISVTITKLHDTNGIFTSGTIQYFITYYNKFLQETDVVYQSSLLYVSPQDRGGSVTETVQNSFRLEISNLNTDFDYIRVYAVQHTSEDTALIARKVVDLEIPRSESSTPVSVIIIDNGVEGESISPTDLYYKGGIPIAAGTMSSKDQVLFLGDIKILNRQAIDDIIKANVKNLDISFTGRVLQNMADWPVDDYYGYKNQLNIDSFDSITGYKYRETYRFGIQLQDKYGKWSEPIWIKDAKNNVSPQLTVGSNGGDAPELRIPEAYTTIPDQLINDFISKDYVKIRPLVVLPQENERECIAQGVLCPTVYNAGDRYDNSPFAQPSWFFRPYVPSNGPLTINNYGSKLPFIHNAVIQGRTSLNGEIEIAPFDQIYDREVGIHWWSGDQPSQQFPPFMYPDENIDNWLEANKNNYYVDQSIITLNSPDIDFNDNIYKIDLGGYSFRIVGAIGLSGYSGSMEIITSTRPNNYYESSPNDIVAPTMTSKIAEGFYKTNVFANNISQDYGGYLMCNGAYWIDAPYAMWFYGINLSNQGIYPNKRGFGFVVYPWQRTGSLNNYNITQQAYQDSTGIESAEIIESATLKNKTVANIRYAATFEYLQDELPYDTSDIQVVDSDSKDTVELTKPTNNGFSGTKFRYYAKVDKLLNLSALSSSQVTAISEPDKSEYSIFVANTTKGIYDSTTPVATNRVFKSLYNVGEHLSPSTSILAFKNSATSITYNSSRHVVIALNNEPIAEGSPEYTQVILPKVNGIGSIQEGSTDNKGWIGQNEYKPTWLPGPKYDCREYLYGAANDHNGTLPENLFKIKRAPGYNDGYAFWDRTTKYIKQDSIQFNTISNFSTLLLGEIYRPVIENKFGGDSDYAIQQNNWIPAGEAKVLTPNNPLELHWIEGDTYFQRYDCLKTYPLTDSNENNVVEILSFMCESRVNIAGRHDKNRGLKDNTLISNENFNLLNKAYTQNDNFFSYRVLDSRFDNNYFPNQITWSTVKKAGALVDNWTSITLASTLDLDGDKGGITALRRYNNEILSFQPKGIAQIKFNSNIQISTQQNVPIELANSGKVDGKAYITDTIGCQDKWSICSAASGLYFIDNINKSIYNYGSNGFKSITDSAGLRVFIQNNSTLNHWLPSNSDAFRTSYDSTHGDLYFINKDYCLVYSELIGQFTSFMSYEEAKAMDVVGNRFYAFHNNGIYEQFAGQYNNIFGKDREYYIEFIENQNPEISKIYTNLEFRSDTYKYIHNDWELQHFTTFNKIRVYNEYQDTGEVDLETLFDRPSILKKKFRIWRIQIPRDKDNKFNRISNTWTKIKLKWQPDISRTSQDNSRINNNLKTELHDAVVSYYF